MRTLVFFLLFSALEAQTVSSEEIRVETRSRPGALAGTPFLVDDEFRGLLGDSILLSEGKHELAFKGQYNYWFQVYLDVAQNEIKILKNDVHRYSSCIDSRVDLHSVQEWPLPELTRAGQGRAAEWRIVLPDPVYVSKPGPEGGCREESSLGRMKELGSVVLNFSSTPSGASIYVNGKERGKTDSRLVVPFFDSDKKILITIRNKGYVNCTRVIPLPASGEHRVDCPLIAASQPARRKP